jgi:FtsZ-binding cell division protein ZapB
MTQLELLAEEVAKLREENEKLKKENEELKNQKLLLLDLVKTVHLINDPNIDALVYQSAIKMLQEDKVLLNNQNINLHNQIADMQREYAYERYCTKLGIPYIKKF